MVRVDKDWVEMDGIVTLVTCLVRALVVRMDPKHTVISKLPGIPVGT